MEIMYALIVGVIVMLGVVAYAVSKNKTVYILKEIEKKEEPKKEESNNKAHKEEEPKEEPKAETIKAKKPTKSKKEEGNPPRNYGEFWKPMVEPIPYTKNRIVVDRYEISNMGRVWDKKREALLSVAKDKRNGEASVSLATKTMYTRRALKVLVATTFIGAQNSKNYIVVNCDGNPNNCAASNLRWKKSGKGRKVGR